MPRSVTSRPKRKDGQVVRLHDERGPDGRPAFAAQFGSRGRRAVSGPSCSSWCAARCRAAPNWWRFMPGCWIRPKASAVVFRTLDIGSDKVLPYMKPNDEPNPALGWRAIRVGLDKPGIMRMQLQALIRAANGRPLTVMFPFVAQFEEYRAARRIMEKTLAAEERLGHVLPSEVSIGAMLETPSLGLCAGEILRRGRFPLHRRQRSEAVLLCRRPRERTGAAAL